MKSVEAIEKFLEQKTKPLLASIREAECIGCTKCIQVCPVDAIMGAAKQMHTVLSTECIGCELCIEPCPVDCIDMVILDARGESEQRAKAEQALKRWEFRNQRLQKNQPIVKPVSIVAARKAAVQAAVERVKAKRISYES